MKKLAFLLFATLLAFNAYSAYLRNVPVDLKQPDGSVIHCFITGDEFHRRVHDKDNYTILQNPATGYYVYALKVGEELVPSEYVVGKDDPKQIVIEPNLDIPFNQMEGKRTEMLKSTKISSTASTKVNFCNLVVFIRFADEEEYTDKLTSFKSIFNNNEFGANSVYNYYKEASYGQLEVTSLFYPTSTTETVLSYKDSNPRNYYSNSSPSNPNGYKTSTERFEREFSLLSQALSSIKGNIPSTELLDGNNDGFIDNVNFIIKGTFDSWGGLLWAHASSMESENFAINGKIAARYTINLSELVVNSNYDIGGGVGELCHELFHTMGAPDLYHYGASGDPVSIWDLMGTTFSTPQKISAYMKFRYGKWINEIPEITNEGVYTLNPLSSATNNCYKLKSPNSNTEYFVFEYRNQVFNFQNSNISKGLLIYLINTLKDGQGNANGPPDEIYVYRPYGSIKGVGAKSFAPFNESEGRTTFNDTSNPSSFLSDGQLGLMNISEIGLAGESISFKVNKAPEKLLLLDYPNNPLLITVGDTLKLEWKSYQLDKVNLEYTTDGISWNLIIKDLPSKSSQINQYSWKVPNHVSKLSKIRISNSEDSEFKAESKNYFSIINEAPPTISVIFPNGNENLEFGTQQVIKWKSSKVELINLMFSIDDGITWKTIQNSVPATNNQYTWTIPGFISERCKVKISDSTFDYTYDESNESFSISSPPNPAITIAFPNGAETFETGTYHQILWQNLKSKYLNIDYSTDDGKTWNAIAEKIDASKSSYGWKIPNNQSPNCRIRLTDYEKSLIVDASDSVFSIVSRKFPGFWEKTNGFSGARVQAMVINARGELISSCFRSTDNGETWQKMKIDNPSVKEFYGIFKHPVNGYLFATSGDIGSGIFRSTDQGDNWEMINGNISTKAITVDKDGNLYTVEWSGNLYKSIDNGDSWNFVGSIPDHGNPSNITINFKNEIFVGSLFKGIHISRDEGKTWSSYITQAMESASSIIIDKEGTIYACGDMFYGVGVSKDGGITWEIRNKGFDCPELLIESLFIDEEGVLYAGSAHYGLFKSLDKGNTWISLKGPNVLHIHSIIIDKNENIFLGSTAGIRKLPYGSNNWEEKNNGLSGDQIFRLMADKDNNVFIGANSGVHFSSDQGRNWESRNVPADLTTIYGLFETSKGSILSGLNGPGFYRSIDKGINWVEIPIRFNPFSFSEDIKNGIIYARNGRDIYRSSDDGINWENIFRNSNMNFPLLSIAVNKEGYLFAGTYFGDGIIISRDFGKSWLPIEGFQGSTVRDIQIDSDGIIYAGLEGSMYNDKKGLYKSNDDGISWEYCGPQYAWHVLEVLFTNSKKTIILSQPDGIYLSNNKGKNWYTVDDFQKQQHETYRMAVDQNNYLYASTDEGNVFASNYAIHDSISSIPSKPIQIITSFYYTGVFKWNQCTDAEKYNLVVSKDYFFKELVLDTVVSETEVYKQLVVGQNYYWKVLAKNGTINSPWSEIRNLEISLNKAPIANAGTDHSVVKNTTVNLNGSESYDPEGNKLTYKWIAPNGITLNSINIANPAFIAPNTSIDVQYKFTLIVNDGISDSPADEVVITVKLIDEIPVANAGLDIMLPEGMTLTLDGSASSDPNGKTLTYNWTVPIGITFDSLTIARPTFTAPEVLTNTSYIITLVVNNGIYNSCKDQLSITVKNYNKIPVANACTDQILTLGATVTLDGSQSYDPDGEPITFKWTAPAGITLSSTTASKPTFTAPEISANTNYTFSLVVNDGTVDSPADEVIITVKQANQIPVANAGIDQNVNEGTTVTLDGSSSSDPDNDPLTYKWTAPSGITLSSTTIAKPTFTAPQVSANTTYTFTLVVNDGTVDSPADQVVITVKQVNQTPVANAGIDQNVNEGTIFTLDGSQSSDPDSDPLTYKWTAPAGISLSSTTAPKPTFTSPEVSTNTTYTFTLVVNDGTVDSPADQVIITVKQVNQTPVANAGIDQNVNEGTIFTLDGSQSSDPDSDPLTYKWTAPAGISLSSTTAQKPIFVAPMVFVNTTYTFTLVVNDGKDDSSADQVVITVNNVLTLNKQPIANAGPDQIVISSLDFATSDEKTAIGIPLETKIQVLERSPSGQILAYKMILSDQAVEGGTTVELNGTGSSDPDGDLLTYKWTAQTGITLSSTTATKPTFIAPYVSRDTPYIFSLVVNDGTIDSPSATVKVTVMNVLSVGVSSIESPIFNVYPNPTTGIVNLELTGGTDHKTEVSISSLVGAEIFRKEITDAAKFQIDLSNQVNGIYMLKVISDNQQYISKIVIGKE